MGIHACARGCGGGSFNSLMFFIAESSVPVSKAVVIYLH